MNLKSGTAVLAVMLCPLVAVQHQDPANAAQTVVPSRPVPANLQGAAAVLQQTAPKKAAAVSVPATSSNVKELRQELAEFGKQAGELPVEEAVSGWMALAKKYNSLTFSSSDLIPGSMPISFRDLVAVLPPPPTWNALAAAIIARQPLPAKRSVNDISMLMVAHALTSNKAALWRDEAALQAKLKSQGTATRAYRYMRSGSEPQLQDVIALIAGPKSGAAPGPRRIVGATTVGSGSLVLPDLITEQGPQKAALQIRQALLTQNAQIEVPLGDETRRLAQRQALQLVKQLKFPQWKLAHSVDAVSLFEALNKRFSQPGAMPRVSKAALANLKASKNRAEVYYLLGLITANRTKEAVALANRLGQSGISIPMDAIQALDKAGEVRAVNSFLHDMLAKNPDLPYWSQYISTSARTGTTAPMLQLVRAASTRKGISASRLTQIRVNLYKGLLAADRVTEGVVVLRQLLAQSAQGGAAAQDLSRITLAAQLAGVGHALGRRDWEQEGVRALQVALAKPQDPNRYSYIEYGPHTLYNLGYHAEAEKILITQLKRAQAGGNQSQLALYMGGGAGAVQPLIELAGLYSRNGRHRDVLTLLDDAPGWGAKDLSQIYKMPNSSGTPLGYMAAAALAATGQQEQAVTILKAVINADSGHDPSYKLLVSLEKDEILPFLDEVYSRNRFQERPLIWKAWVLQQSGDMVEAEKAARAAIAIDPSDGEEGKGDRMRVYAVLADIREARGDAAQAKLFRGAVKAIRLSENADDVYAAGLLLRGIRMYEHALTYFSDAYCIQSRLAIQLSQLGRNEEAEQHYRRAYELMPDSFGRMESHCFGCERAFAGHRAEKMAERIFRGFLVKQPYKPQVHYLLGYLREEEGRYNESLPFYKRAVQLDRDYINAWKHIQQLGQRMRLSQADRDAAALNLLRLDPQGRNVQVDLTSLSDLRVLWQAVEAAAKHQAPPVPKELYPLVASEPQAEKLQEEARKMMAQYGMVDDSVDGEEESMEMSTSVYSEFSMDAYGGMIRNPKTPGQAIAGHKFIAAITAIRDAQNYASAMQGMM